MPTTRLARSACTSATGSRCPTARQRGASRCDVEVIPAACWAGRRSPTAMRSVVADLDLRLRPFAGEADIPHLVRIANADAEADGVPSRRSEPDMLAWVRHPTESSNPARDVIVAEVDGEPIAYAEKGWVDNSDSESREYWVGGALLPSWRRRGIGTVLLLEAEKQARELASSHATQRRKLLGSWSSDRQDGR